MKKPITEGPLKSRYLVKVQLDYDIDSNEYIMVIESETHNMRFGVPRHRMKDIVKNFNILIERVDKEYPAE